MNEFEMIQGCLRNDRKSQSLLFDKYNNKFLQIVIRYLKDEDESKDVLQDGFVKLFFSLQKFNFKGSFEGWAKRMIINCTLDYLRTKKEIMCSFDDNIESFQKHHIETKQIEDIKGIPIEFINESIEKLTPAYKKAFKMYVFDGLTHKEISEKLKIALGTSKSNYAGAKENLKKMLKVYEDKRI